MLGSLWSHYDQCSLVWKFNKVIENGQLLKYLSVALADTTLRDHESNSALKNLSFFFFIFSLSWILDFHILVLNVKCDKTALS